MYEKCPVCGMFVYKYRDWISAVGFSDGSLLYFDGAKDLFKYLLNTEGDRTRELTGKEALFVTEYYALDVIDARRAFFVVGSNVMGPMGRELVAFRTRVEALEFMNDHGGKRLLRFGDVTPDVVKALDVRQGR
jgi:nitrous oxide reductase accessory protein NosL